MKRPNNMAASVRQRLLNRSRKEKRPFDELLQYYAMERFLFRLSESSYADRFILKGALLMRIWGASKIRPTKDIDLLGKTSNDVDEIVRQVKSILSIDVENDGLTFDSDSIQAERITEDADYEGIRITFKCTLDTASISMQIDIGFGDIVFPEPVVDDYPALLDFPSPKLLCYSRESSIAEKCEAMVKLGELNSRMKDFYDIWLLSRQFPFKGDRLSQAIRKTFETRHTRIPSSLKVVNESFIADKQVQWEVFLRRLQHETASVPFREVISVIDDYLSPIFTAIASAASPPKQWNPPGPWV